jgi:hypothetical protein
MCALTTTPVILGHALRTRCRILGAGTPRTCANSLWHGTCKGEWIEAVEETVTHQPKEVRS